MNPMNAWPQEGLQRLGRCPLCGASERRLLHDGLRDTLFAAPGRWTMYVCGGCGLGYLDPRPSEAMLALAYASYYTHEDRWDDDPSAVHASLARRLKMAVLRAYLRARFGHEGLRGGNALAVAMLARPRLRIGVDAAMRHLPPAHEGSTLLDIGCGNGRFMAWARVAGWRCEGTEVDPAAAARARRLGFVVHDSLVELVRSGRRFDAVTLSHVIEHVHDPRALLASARAVLRDGGYFWVETPNIEAHGLAVFGDKWRGLEPPRHLQLLTPALLRTLLQEAGFTEVRTAPWQLDWANVAALTRANAGLAPPRGLAWRWRGEEAERIGRADPARREFITMTASAATPAR